jgi:hypothetical protein
MSMDALALAAVISTLRKREEVVPEPEFRRFVFPKKATRALAPANSTRQARTLAELGVPGGLAADMESTFRLLGLTDGARVMGISFQTPDGAVHALRDGSAPTSRDADTMAA